MQIIIGPNKVGARSIHSSWQPPVARAQCSLHCVIRAMVVLMEGVV